MGWYTNYEVEFDERVDWDDDGVKKRLEPFNVQHLYLRDLDVPRAMLCVYSQTPLREVLAILKELCRTGLSYRMYNSGEEWVKFR